ncbi:MAG: hypothetical protein AABW87_00655 [Nanoarchaeota archaeon]
MKTISKIDVASFVRIYMIFGLVLGVLTAVLNLIAMRMNNMEMPSGTGLVTFLVFNILVYAVLIALVSLLFVWVYNSLAKKDKGIKIELK